MNDIEKTAQIFNNMYEALFLSFFGTSGISAFSDVEKLISLIPRSFKVNPSKCPAKAIVINAISKIHSPQPELKKTVKSFISSSELINFEELDFIYTAAIDQHLDTQRIEQLKQEILDIINPQYLVAIHLYMKYHKVFIKELFDAFCGMIITGNKCPSNDIHYFCFAALNNGEELVNEVKECIYGTNGKITKKPEQLYREVYSEFLAVVREFSSFEAYKPKIETFSEAINEVLDLAKSKWKPKNPKRNKSGVLFTSTVEQYLDILTKLIRKKVIINFDTKSGQSKSGEPNLRTMRTKCSALTKKFYLDVYEDSEKIYQIQSTSCPDFLLEELWECLKNYGLKEFPQAKLKPDYDSLIDSKRIVLMGRLYIIMLLCYAFDSKNYGGQYSFKEIIDRSLKEKQVIGLLSAYHVFTTNIEDKAIIKEIITQRSKS